MNWIRGFLFYLVFSIAVILFAVACLVTWPIVPVKARYRYIALPWLRCIIWILKTLCGIRYEVRGLETLQNLVNDPQGVPRIVILSKHQSAWETLFLPLVIPNPMGYVYKRSLHRVPFFGWALKSFNMIAIDRGEGRSAFSFFLKRGEQFMRSGWWVTLFPEGTRTAPGATQSYKTGGVRFARATNSKIVAVALNSGYVWPRNTIAKIPGCVTVSFSDVIDPAGRDVHAVTEEVQNWIEGELKKIDLEHGKTASLK